MLSQSYLSRSVNLHKMRTCCQKLCPQATLHSMSEPHMVSTPLVPNPAADVVPFSSLLYMRVTLLFSIAVDDLDWRSPHLDASRRPCACRRVRVLSLPYRRKCHSRPVKVSHASNLRCPTNGNARCVNHLTRANRIVNLGRWAHNLSACAKFTGH